VTGAEIVQFSSALNGAFNVNELRALVLGLNRKFEDYTSALKPFPDQVQELVAAANSQNWIAQLVSAVVASRPDNPALKPFLSIYPFWDPGRAASAGHPCDALRVLGGKSFIGRQTLRKFLKKMNTAIGKKVLIVTSEQRKIGKTYSMELLNFLAASTQDARVAYVDLDKENYDPGQLTAKLGGQMHKAMPGIPQPNEQQDARWNQDLVDWLVPIPDNNGTVWWIVLDGFREKLPSEGVQDLIAQLAQRIQGTINFRLILINFTYRLPLGVDAFSFRDKISPIQRQEVEDFLKRVHVQKYNMDPSPVELSDYLAAVYGRLQEYIEANPDEAGNQLLLNRAVSEATEVILED
jgi:hypothetical protein